MQPSTKDHYGRFRMYRTLADIPLAEYKKRGIKVIAIDWENTCSPLVRRKPWQRFGRGKARYKAKFHKLPPGTIRFLRKASSMGFMVVIATNKVSDFDPILRHLRSSGATNVAVFQPTKGKKTLRHPFASKSPKKPEPEFFRQLASRMCHSATVTLMIGDKYRHDVLPALELGMKGILVPPSGPDMLPERFVARRWRDSKKLKADGHSW